MLLSTSSKGDDGSKTDLEVALSDATLLPSPLAVLPDDAPGVEEPQEAAAPQLAVAKGLVHLLLCVQVELPTPEQSWPF